MLVEVVKFNKARNGLKLDEKLEISMLDEEIKEFWGAETVADRVDALIDTRYVWLGTVAKYSYNCVEMPQGLSDRIEQSVGVMTNYLREELGEHFNMVIANAVDIVCKANAIKGSKLDENGKVKKDKAYTDVIDATKQIALMIEEITKPTEY